MRAIHSRSVSGPVARTAGPVGSSVTYVTPVVAVIVGALILGEGVRLHEPIGAAIVLLGVAITQGRVRLPLPARRVSDAGGA